MDWKLFFATFALIFLAELGDKTQLSTFAFASRSGSPVSVFLGASVALVCTSLLAVVLGELIGRIVPERFLKIAAGVLFLGFGVWTIVEGVRN